MNKFKPGDRVFDLDGFYPDLILIVITYTPFGRVYVAVNGDETTRLFTTTYDENQLESEAVRNSPLYKALS